MDHNGDVYKRENLVCQGGDEEGSGGDEDTADRNPYQYRIARAFLQRLDSRDAPVDLGVGGTGMFHLLHERRYGLARFVLSGYEFVEPPGSAR